MGATGLALAQRLPTKVLSAAWSTIGTTLVSAVYAAGVGTDGTRIYIANGNRAGVDSALTIVTPDGTAVYGPNRALSRQYVAATWCNGRFWVIGGANSSTGLGTVEAYTPAGANGASGTWATSTPLNGNATTSVGGSAAAVGNYIYVAGGSAGASSTAVPVNTSAQVWVARYNTASGTTGAWEIVTSLPAARYVGSMVSVGTKLYYLGGQDNTGTATSTVYVYDTANGTTGTWSTMPYTLTAPGEWGRAVVGSTVYSVTQNTLRSTDLVTGAAALLPTLPSGHGTNVGVVAIGSTVYAVSGSGTANVDALDTQAITDLATPTWSTLSALPATRYAMAVSTDGTTIYASGGTNSPASALNTGVTVTTGGTVTTMTQPNISVYGAAGVWCNGRHWMLGGFDGNTYYTYSRAYAPAGTAGAAGTWSAVSALTSPKYYSSAAAVGNRIYLAGGQINGSAFSLATAQLDVLDTAAATPTWTTLTASPMPAARTLGAMVTVGTNLYYLGGFDTAGSLTNTVFIFDTVAGTWSTGAPLGTGVAQYPWAAVGTTLYSLGGTTTNYTYNVTTGAFTTSTITVPAGHGGYNGLVAIGALIYALGGQNTANIDALDTAAVAAGSSYQRKLKALQGFLAANDPVAYSAARQVPATMPSAPAWTSLPYGPTYPTYGAAVSSDGARIYMTHGNSNGALIGSGLSMAPSAGGILTVSPNPRQYVAGAWCNGKHYAIGGINGGALNRVEAYTPAGTNGAAGTWSTPAPLPVTLAYAAAASIGTMLYVAGGTTGTNAATASTAVYAMDTAAATPAWLYIADMPAQRYQGALVAYKTKLFYFSGLNNAGTGTTTVFVYDTATGNWTSPSGAVMGSNASLAATVVGNYAYSVAGANAQRYNLDTLSVDATAVLAPSDHGTAPRLATLGNSIYLVSGQATAYTDGLDVLSGPAFVRQVAAVKALAAIGPA